MQSKVRLWRKKERTTREIMTAAWHSLHQTPQVALRNPTGKKAKKSSQLSLVPWIPGILYFLKSVTVEYQPPFWKISHGVPLRWWHILTEQRIWYTRYLLYLSETVGNWIIRLYSEHILACFGRLSLGNDFIGPYYNRTITEIRPNDLLYRGACFHDNLNCREC